jgi:hypothetical protein
MAGMPLDPVNAVLGWLTQQLGNAAVAGLRGVLFGDAQQRVFRRVVSRAIDRVVQQLGGDREEFLRQVLVENREGLEDVRHLPDLASVVSAVVAMLDHPDQPNQVAPPGLAEALTTEIRVEVLEDARAGGPLAPLVAEERFVELFALNAELREMILRQLDSPAPHPMVTNVFAGGGRSLRQAYLDPDPARGRACSRSFTGRGWLLREIDDFVARYDRGYFIVEADAGTGKTAFALWCSGSRGWPIHFAEHNADARRIAPAVRNLVAQLIVAWDLHDLAPAGVLPTGADWSSLLWQVLTAAARVAQPATPIIVVVDGLDEAVDVDFDSLPFGLPDDLPTGVFVVATVKTGRLQHHPTAPMAICNWNQRRTQQRADLETFLHHEWARLHVSDAITQDGTTEAEFVTTLLDRSDGVWLYCHFALVELISGTGRPRDIPSLPQGLVGYYYNAIGRWARTAEARAQEPVLATLAVALEPLDVAMLTQLSGVNETRTVDDLLHGLLRPFFAESDDRWTVRHSSFAEYVVAGPDAVALADVKTQQDRLADHACAAHRRISDRYLHQWGGLDAGLPALAADPALPGRDGGYPLRALASHLVAGGRTPCLHALLACGTDDRNIWYAAHDAAGDIAGFLDDVATARRALAPADVSLHTRYALIESAAATVSSNVSPGLLAVLVERGFWSVPRALATIRRIADNDQQAQALLWVIPFVPDDLIPDAWGLALSLNGGRRLAEAVLPLIDRLPTDLLGEAVRSVAVHAREPIARTAAARLTRRLSKDRLRNYPFEQMPDMAYKDKMLVAALPMAATSILNSLRDPNKFQRCQDLAELVPFLPADSFSEAIAMLRSLPARYRSDALIALVESVPLGLLADVLRLAADAAWEATPPEATQQPWIHLTRAACARLTTQEQETAAVAVCLELQEEHCAEAIEILAPHLSVDTSRRALRDVKAAHRYDDESHALLVMVGALAARLPGSEALGEIASYADPELRLTEEPGSGVAEQLAAIAEFVHPDSARMALRNICRIISLDGGLAMRLRPALTRFAPLVGRDPALLDEVLTMMTRPDAWHPQSRLMVLEVLAPHLDNHALERAGRRLLPGPFEIECFTAVAALARTLSSEADRFAVAQDALDRIREIDNVQQRVRAVGALAPCLPEPLAAVALEMVGSMTRRVMFPSILVALDALGPQLPSTALPRAMEILMDIPMVGGEEVKHVTNLMRRLACDDPHRTLWHYFRDPKHPRARRKESWLWAMAPFLDPVSAEAALSEARDQPDYARRISLAALAPRLPHDLRPAVAREVLDLLSVAPQSTDIRMAVLARLAEAVRTDELTAACRDVASTLDQIGPDSFDGSNDVLQDLLIHLPDEVVVTAAEAGRRRRYLMNRCLILRPLIPRLPAEMVAALVIDLQTTQGEMGADERERARCLVALADRVRGEERDRILSDVLDRAERNRSWYTDGPALLDLIPIASPSIRARAVEVALRRCVSRYNGGQLEPLVELLHGTELDIAFTRAHQIAEPAKRIAVIAIVLRRAAEASPAPPGVDVIRSWQAARNRAELFTLVAASAWWVHVHGGDAAATAAVTAAFDAAQWWR